MWPLLHSPTVRRTLLSVAGGSSALIVMGISDGWPMPVTLGAWAATLAAVSAQYLRVYARGNRQIRAAVEGGPIMLSANLGFEGLPYELRKTARSSLNPHIPFLPVVVTTDRGFLRIDKVTGWGRGGPFAAAVPLSDITSVTAEPAVASGGGTELCVKVRHAGHPLRFQLFVDAEVGAALAERLADEVARAPQLPPAGLFWVTP